ncbi:MAG: hypothetical protein V2A62_03070 [Candidatus Woesearchaeota archaeon]
MFSQPKLKQGQVSKTVVIAIIVIVLLLALVWFFWGKQLVGKAIEIPNAAGFSPVGTFITGKNITLTVSANIGTAQTLGAEFNLTLPNGVNCNKIEVKSLLAEVENLTLANDTICKGNQLFFRHFNLFAYDEHGEPVINFKTEQFDIARITIKDGLDPGNYFFNFSYFEIVDFEDYKNLVTTIVPIGIKVTGEGGEIFIKATSKEDSKVATTEVKPKEYTITTTINPLSDLPANHLVLVTINVKGVQKAQFWHTLSALAKGNSETVSFDYTFPAKGPVAIKAMVWKNLLLYNTTWDSLITPAAEKEYTVSNE